MPKLSLLARRFQEMETRRQLTLAVIAIAVIGAFFFMFQLATSTPYTDVVAGVTPQEAGKVQQTLSSAGIDNQLQNGGTAVAVPNDQVDQARVAIATSGVPVSNQPGLELFDKAKLGTTDFQQQVMYKRALEGQLSNMISQINGVDSATVTLVLPENQLFTDQASLASASVLLSGTTQLDPAAVRGIAKLVSGSVQGLTDKRVSITDSNGQLIWPSAAASGSGPTKQAAQDAFSAQVGARINGLLAATLGPGMAYVQVSSDLNVDKTRLQKLTYGPKAGIPLVTDRSQESLDGNGTAGGTAGTAGNVPVYQAAGANGGATRYRQKADKTTYGVNKQVQSTIVAPGTVNRMSVALVVSSKVPPARLQQLQRTVSAAAGLVPARGDQISVAQMPFTAPKATKPSVPLPQMLLPYAKWLVLGIGVLIFLFLVWRSLRRRDKRTVAVEPEWLKRLEASQIPEAPAAPPQRMAARAVAGVDTPVQEKSQVRQQVDRIADESPEQLAQQLSSWLNSDD